MPVSASALRELHRIHRQITDLKGQLERGPKQIRAAESLLERLETAVVSAKDALTHTRVLADGKQLQLREREGRIKDLQVKLNTCSSNREYQALKEQIAADQQANSVLSDEILDALERIDVLQAEFTKIQSRTQQGGRRTAVPPCRVRRQAGTIGVGTAPRDTGTRGRPSEPCRLISGLNTIASREPEVKMPWPKSTEKRAATAITCSPPRRSTICCSPNRCSARAAARCCTCPKIAPRSRSPCRGVHSVSRVSVAWTNCGGTPKTVSGEANLATRPDP